MCVLLAWVIDFVAVLLGIGGVSYGSIVLLAVHFGIFNILISV